MYQYKVTVFTPTYNRAYILEQLYSSLQRQTEMDFEWLVVDDGSTDNTSKLFEKWKKEDNKFPIRYVFQKNGGKQRAVNHGLQLARGELFLNLDSDDFLADNAIELVIKYEKSIQDRKDEFAGVAGLKYYHDGSLIGTTFRGGVLDISCAVTQKYGITGDRAEVWYTDLFKKHLFPEIEGEKFISEGVTWLEICYEEKRVLRYFNECLIYCEYLDDGYSKNDLNLLLSNPKGVCLTVKKTIKYMKLNYFEKLKQWHRYIIVGKKLGYSGKRIREDLEISIFDYCMIILGKSIQVLRKRICA